ncbi:MAG: DUF2939 domain-containing protein [Chloroflexota bacterium]|jgi:hypothetical protein
MNIRVILVGVVAVLVLLLGYVVATPYLTVAQMQAAAQARDGKTLAEYIDFVAVRESLNTQLTAMLANEMSQSTEDDAMGLLGAAFGSKIIELLLDAIVTPEGLIAVLNGDPMTDVLDQNATQSSSTSANTTVSMGYQSLDTFGVTITNADTQSATTLLLRRDGLSWRLSEILLPNVLE